MTTIKLAEADVQNCSWTLVEITPTYRRYIGKGDHPVTGLPITVQKTEFIGDEAIQALNAEERNERDGKRWSSGAGSEKGGNVPMMRVARIPMNKLFSDFAGRWNDDDFTRWWINNERNQPFRTRSGRV